MHRPPTTLSHLNAANLVTVAGAASSMAAVGFVVRAHSSMALTLMMVAVLCDRLDGLVARRFDLSSAFGMQLDSLADTVSFLVVPAALVLVLSEGNLLLLGAVVPFVLCGIWRLAHFNVAGETTVFHGLSTTHAAGFFILLWALGRLFFAEQVFIALGIYLFLVAPLMVSSVPIQKNGWLTKGLQLLLLPTLVASWWPV